MPYFVVLVVGTPECLLEAAMEPFSQLPRNRAHLAFRDVEDVYRQKYAEGSLRVTRCATGQVIFPWEMRHYGSNSALLAGSTQELVPFSTLYPTFEAFMASYAGYPQRDEAHGRYGYYRNPNVKWDFFQVGTPNPGFFLLRPGAGGKINADNIFGAHPLSSRSADIVTLGGWDRDRQRENGPAVLDDATALAAGVPFAVLKNGFWYQRAPLAEESLPERNWATWERHVALLLKDLPDGTPLIALTCYLG